MQLVILFEVMCAYLKFLADRSSPCQHSFTCPFLACSRNRPFPSSPGPLYQNEVRCSAFDVRMIFHSHANKTHFHKKGCALGLILKVRVFETRKWPILWMNQVRSLLSMRCMSLGCSLEPRPNSRALATASTVMTIGLSRNGCSHSKKTVWRGRTRLTRSELWVAAASKVWRDSGRALGNCPPTPPLS